MSSDDDDELLRLNEITSKVFPNKIYVVILYILCTAGMIGNVLSLIVLFNMKMKSSISICLKFLAGFDTLLLTCILVETAVPDAQGMRWIHSLTWITWTGSIGATVGVTVERYIAVCHPLRAKYLCSNQRTLIFNLAIVFFSICFNIPRICLIPEIAWKGGSTEFSLYLYRRFGKKSIQYLPPWFFRSKLYIEICYVWMDIAVITVPLIFLTALYVSIYLSAKKARRIRREMSQHHEVEINLSVLIFGIILIFLICYTPPLIFKISSCSGFVPLELHLEISFFCDILAATNSAINFIIYCVLTKEFRKTFLNTFCMCVFKQEITSEIFII